MSKEPVTRSLFDIVEGERKDIGTPTDRLIITDDAGVKYLRLSKFDSVESIARKIIAEDL